MKELENLVNTGRLVQNFLLKQADIDKILKIIQWKICRGTHLPVTVKEIQVGYLVNSYFKVIYLYLAQKNLPSNKCNQKGQSSSRKIYIIRLIII